MDIGKKILQRRIELGIKSNVELARRMGGIVHPNTIGKWIAGKSVPRGPNLIALVKTLNTTVESLTSDEDEGLEPKEELKEIVQREIKKILKEAKIDLEEELTLFLKSDKIPQEDKDALIRQARNLLKLYKEIE